MTAHQDVATDRDLQPPPRRAWTTSLRRAIEALGAAQLVRALLFGVLIVWIWRTTRPEEGLELTGLAVVVALTAMFLATALVVAEIFSPTKRPNGSESQWTVEEELRRVAMEADRRMDRALTLAILSALVGFLLIIGPVSHQLGDNAAGANKPYYWIAAAGGVVTEFIAATFFYILARTGAQVRAVRSDLVSYMKFDATLALVGKLNGSTQIAAIEQISGGLGSSRGRSQEEADPYEGDPEDD